MRTAGRNSKSPSWCQSCRLPLVLKGKDGRRLRLILVVFFAVVLLACITIAFFKLGLSVKMNLGRAWQTGGGIWVSTGQLERRWGRGTAEISAKLPKLPELQLPNGRSFLMRVNVLTYDRYESLSRLVTSLQAAKYDGSRVDLNFFLDRKQGHEPNRRILDLIENADWPHGEKRVMVRQVNVGLIGAVLESWYPTYSNEYTMFAEDDIEVSPYWFYYAKRCIESYRMVPNPDQNIVVCLSCGTYYPHKFAY